MGEEEEERGEERGVQKKGEVKEEEGGERAGALWKGKISRRCKKVELNKRKGS